MRTLPTDFPPGSADPSWKIGIVHSSFYAEDVERLVDGARETLVAAGIPPENISVHPVPGSFEIPLLGAVLAEKKAVHGLIGLGIIVEGETHHAGLVANEAARGMMDVQVRHRVPFVFEVLYVDKLPQARARSKGAGNKGGEAARVVLYTLQEMSKIS